MKIDVEGAEMGVLLGARRILSEICLDALIWELSGVEMGGAPGEVIELLRNMGYNAYEISNDGLRPFSRDAGTGGGSEWRLRNVCFLRAQIAGG
jgi:hypothetical protein